MNTTDDDKDSLAALYTLGALSEAERLEADQRHKTDPQWQPLLAWWQQRLDPLTQLVEPAAPPPSVWQKIEAQLGEQLSGQQVPDVDVGEPPPHRAPPVSQEPGLIEETIELWRQRARYWQMATLASVVAIASIAAVLVFKPLPFQPQSPSDLPVTVAVLQNEDNVPLWAVSLRKTETDSGEYGELLVTVVGEPQLDSTQSHQMWMVLKDRDEDVQSVGLLPDETGEVRRLVLPRPLSDASELAVSLEPKGGVPGPEHGPVVTRTFVVTSKISDVF